MKPRPSPCENPQGDLFKVKAGFSLLVTSLSGGCSGPCILQLQELLSVPNLATRIHWRLPVDGNFEHNLSGMPVFPPLSIIQIAGEAVAATETLAYLLKGVLIPV